MEFSKLIISSCALFISGYLIAAFQYSQNDASDNTNSFRLKQQYEKTINNLERKLNEKSLELSELQENLNSQSGNYHPLSALPSRVTKNNELAAQTEIEEKFNEPEVLENNTKPNKSEFVPVEEQPEDTSWAPEFANQLTDTFQLSDELYSLGIVTAINCKTTLCEVQFDLNSPEKFNVVFRIKDAFKQTPLQRHGLVFDFLERENRVKILVGRYDDSFAGIYQ